MSTQYECVKKGCNVKALFKTTLSDRQPKKSKWGIHSQPRKKDGSWLPLALSDVEGRTTTCIVTTQPGSSPTNTLDSASVLLFSKILPAFISFMSLIDFGPFSFPAFSMHDFHIKNGICNKIQARQKFYHFFSSRWWCRLSIVLNLNWKQHNDIARAKIFTLWPLREDTLFECGNSAGWGILVGSYVCPII